MLSLNPHKDSMQQLYGYCSRSAIMAAAAAAAAATQNTRQIMPDKPGRETALFQFSIYNGKKWKEPRRLLFQFSTFRISCQLSKIVPYVWQAVTTSLRKVFIFRYIYNKQHYSTVQKSKESSLLLRKSWKRLHVWNIWQILIKKAWKKNATKKLMHMYNGTHNCAFHTYDATFFPNT